MENNKPGNIVNSSISIIHDLQCHTETYKFDLDTNESFCKRLDKNNMDSSRFNELGHQS